MSYWSNKTVLITGAASGIGRATARRFASEGASVAMLDRNERGLKETRQRIGDDSRTRTFTVDLEDEQAVREAVRNSISWNNQLQAAINVAGIGAPEQFPDSTRAEWDSLIQVNLRGGYVVAQEAARHMIQAGGGAIVNVSSILALVADPSLIMYSATKGGVSGITRALAIRLAEHNIRVNAVCPADVATPLLDDWIDRQPDPAEIRATIASAYPLGHYCDPKDIAGVIFFLAGPDARCITGTEIVVDCGLTVKCY